MKYSGDLVRKWYQKWNKNLVVAKINRKSWNNNKIRHSNEIFARFCHFCFVTTFISLNSMYISQTTVNHSCKRRSRIQFDHDRYLTCAFEKKAQSMIIDMKTSKKGTREKTAFIEYKKATDAVVLTKILDAAFLLCDPRCDIAFDIIELRQSVDWWWLSSSDREVISAPVAPQSQVHPQKPS